MKKRIISLLVVCLVLLTIPAQASTSKLQDNLNEVEKSQKETQEKLDANEATVQELQAEISKLDEEIKVVENEVAAIEKQITDTQDELEVVGAELEKAILEKEEQKATLEERLRVMYMYSDTSLLEILFSSSNFSDLITKIDTVKTVADFDQQVFEKLEAMEQEINAKKEEVEQKKASLIELKKQSETKVSSLNEVKVTRSDYASVLKANTDKLEAELNSLAAESSNIENEINRIMAEQAAAQAAQAAQASGNTGSTNTTNTGSAIVNTGQYRWPVPGYTTVNSPYGNRIHPITGKLTFHSGIDIPTGRRTGVNAVAVGDGEVIQSGFNNGGYGNLVIINLGKDKNGNNISAVYAHLAQRYVSAGTKVSAGQAIGEVGTTGSSTGIHLHFEIRVNGSTTNPLSYVR